MTAEPQVPWEEGSKAMLPAPKEPEQPLKVVEDDGDGVIARWIQGGPITATNMPQDGPQGRALVTQALSTPELRTRDVVGQPLSVVGYVVHIAELTDKITGEITRKLRAVLILEDGRMVSTMSAACIRTLHYLAKTAGKAKWEPPLILEIKTHPLEGGKSYCDMREIAAGTNPDRTRRAKS